MKAIIIGAGIGGLSAGIALRQVGMDVEIYEKAHEIKEVGAGIVLYPNALDALKKLGVFDEIVRAGSPARRALYITSDGKTLVEMDAVKEGAIQTAIVIHRAELQRVLAEKLDVEVQLGHHCANLHQNGGVSVTFASGAKAEGDVLVGADGLRSVVREAVLHDGAPQYAGCFAWRGVARLVNEVVLPETGMLAFGCGLQFGAMHIRDDQIYWFGSVADPVGAQGRTTKQHVLNVFGDWCEPIPQLIQATVGSEILTHDLYDRQPSEKWGEGRVTLLGDAAHPMTPFMGQGGCQAIEDAVALGVALRDVTSIEQSLRSYENKRMKRANSFVIGSRNSQRMSMTNLPVLCNLRNAFLRMVPKKLLLKQLHTLSN